MTQMPDIKQTQPGMDKQSPLAIFLIFLRLGCTSFGGPVAHLGYFREEFVARRKWFDDQTYGDLVALCQFLPGPASSQVGLSIGLAKGGLMGSFMAWVGFTLPSAFLLFLFGYGLIEFQDQIDGGFIQGLKIVAVAVVGQAIWAMSKSLCPDRERATLAILAACLLIVIPSSIMQLAVILIGALIGTVLFKPDANKDIQPLNIKIPYSFAIAALGLFFLILVFSILGQSNTPSPLSLFQTFFTAGSLVFGGGHVVLPLLEAEVVQSGWISKDVFLAGYGATQAVPGPLFTFAAFLGTVMETAPNGLIGASLALIAIFAPSFLLVFGALPFWDVIRQTRHAQRALMGVNAAVVGILIAAFYDPIWTSAIMGPKDLAFALIAFAVLEFWKLPPWLVVLGAGLIGWFG